MYKLIAGLLILSALAGTALAQTPEESIVTGNNAFAFDSYQTLRGESGNLIFSPYSISQAFAMTYAGARGNTESQMADVFHFALSQEALHSTFGVLTDSFNAQDDTASEEETPFQLNIVNRLWGLQGYTFNADYLSLIEASYGAGLEPMDFAGQPEESRQIINTWVADQTEDRIQDLLPADSITADTRLVLTNAVYFKAGWLFTFTEENTRDEVFTLGDGATVTAPLMSQSEYFRYVEGQNYQALSLAYENSNTEMLVILPQAGEFEAVEATFSEAMYNEILAGLSEQYVWLMLPRFESEFSTRLSDPLISLGLTDAFDPNAADFSGMLPADSADELFISDAIHKAFIKVDESGTEAAAATAIIMETAMAVQTPDPIAFHANRPFLYLIYDRTTGSILFMGRVLNPVE